MAQRTTRVDAAREGVHEAGKPLADALKPVGLGDFAQKLGEAP